MYSAAIIGGSGYTGSELARILVHHPQISLDAMTSRQNAGYKVSKAMPFLNGFTDLNFIDRLEDGSHYDVIFSATPHGASMDVVPGLQTKSKKVIDLSGDYRLGDPQVYKKWYGEDHHDLLGLSKAVYGMSEVFRPDIEKAELVSNPGCYPTCSILSLAPLFAEDLVEGHVIIDAKSGTSGAGQELTKMTHHPNCGATVIPYKVGSHRHTPEIKMALDRLSHHDIEVVFTPHLLPIVRGMLCTNYVKLKKDMTIADLVNIYSSYYGNKRFIRMVDIPSIPSVVGSNFCEIGIQPVGQRNLVVMSALDNLTKGGAGQAVQNANIMLGLNEAAGLDFPGMGV